MCTGDVRVIVVMLHTMSPHSKAEEMMGVTRLVPLLPLQQINDESVKSVFQTHLKLSNKLLGKLL